MHYTRRLFSMVTFNFWRTRKKSRIWPTRLHDNCNSQSRSSISCLDKSSKNSNKQHALTVWIKRVLLIKKTAAILKDIIMETSNGKYLNPAYPNVRELIINGVKEVVEKYPVDGVQFDDYFYPDIVNVINGEFFVTINAEVDKIAYGNYCNLPGNNQPLSLEEWRFANINALISGVYSAIKKYKFKCCFWHFSWRKY